MAAFVLMDGSFEIFTGVFSSSSFVIRADGELFAFGHNGDGQLGVGDYENRTVPTRVHNFQEKEIAQISCGKEHTLFLASTGKQVYSCGSNQFSQLGLGTEVVSETNFDLSIPNEVELNKEEEDIVVVELAAGAFSSYYVTKSGKVYAFGRNNDGELGIGTKSKKNGPTLVAFPSDVKISSISAGSAHVATLSEDKKVYTFGWDTYGRLGVEGDGLRPQLVEDLASMEASRVICGALSTFVIISSNEVYSFGYNGSGGLGIGNQITGEVKHALRPERINFFNLRPLSSVDMFFVGGVHSIGILSGGDVIGFGLNDEFQLIERSEALFDYPFVITESFADVNGISFIACGNRHTLVVSSDGKCYGGGSSSAFGRTLMDGFEIIFDYSKT